MDEEATDEIDRLKIELQQVRAEAEATLVQCAQMLEEARTGNAQLLNALNAALIWGEALFAWAPEGTALPEGVKTAKGALDLAIQGLREGRRHE